MVMSHCARSPAGRFFVSIAFEASARALSGSIKDAR